MNKHRLLDDLDAKTCEELQAEREHFSEFIRDLEFDLLREREEHRLDCPCVIIINGFCKSCGKRMPLVQEKG